MAALVANLVSVLNRSSSAPDIKYGLPVPDVCHLELGDEVIMGKSVFVIGDVHGCLDELLDLLKVAKNIDPNVLFIFVGDLVNRGPYSLEVLRLVQSGDLDCYTVRGNHEEIVMNQYRQLTTNPEHVLRPKHQWVKSMTPEDYEFLCQLPFTISIPSLQSIVVHAGLVPGLPLPRQSLLYMPRIRNITQEDFFDGGGFVVSSKPDKGVPWSTLWPGPEHVYFGHDARRGLQQRDFATCLDTGCTFGQKLTGIFINGCQKIVSVKAKQVYSVGKPD